MAAGPWNAGECIVARHHLLFYSEPAVTGCFARARERTPPLPSQLVFPSAAVDGRGQDSSVAEILGGHSAPFMLSAPHADGNRQGEPPAHRG